MIEIVAIIIGLVIFSLISGLWHVDIPYYGSEHDDNPERSDKAKYLARMISHAKKEEYLQVLQMLRDMPFEKRAYLGYLRNSRLKQILESQKEKKLLKNPSLRGLLMLEERLK